MAHLHIPMKRADFINMLKKYQKPKQGPGTEQLKNQTVGPQSSVPYKVTDGPPKSAIPASPKGNFDGSPGGWGEKSAPTLGELTAGPWRR